MLDVRVVPVGALGGGWHLHLNAALGAAQAGGGKKGGQKDCRNCKGVGNLPCKACKGTGRNRANGNMLERWKCYDCQGFGLVACPKCGKAGLTPEQRGER